MPLTAYRPAGAFFAGGNSSGFSGDATDPKTLSTATANASQNLLTQGKGLSDTGKNALGPIISMLSKLLSGNAGAVGEAVAPEIRNIEDNYRAARDAIAQFTPRGGGQASATNESYVKEAGDKAATRSTAINNALAQLKDVAGLTLSAGAQEQEAGLQGFADLLKSAVAQQASNRSFWGQLGGAVGKIIIGAGLTVATGGAAAPIAASFIGDAIAGSGDNA